MTEVEELILENQRKILGALSVLLSRGDADDKEMAALTFQGAELTREQVERWKRLGH